MVAQGRMQSRVVRSVTPYLRRIVARPDPMRSLLVGFAGITAFFALLAAPLAAQPRYADVRLAADGLDARLAAAGVVLDHAAPERDATGRYVRTVLDELEIDALRAAGVAVDVLHPDLAARHRDAVARVGGCPSTPYPITGTHGCYPTFDEVLAILDEMHAMYPSLVSERFSIGTTHEGRDLWMVEIGDNPGVDEGEPEVFLNSLHHAREPQGMASLLHAVWSALDGYGTDPTWTRLLDTRRVFVLPVLNPDGYVYNQTTDPQGGGFWRKNRRANTGGTFGVDLNRNYGWEWGYNNSGSSPNSSSDTYRGASAFSEPETAAVRDWMADRAIRLALNTHTFSDLLIYPWGYEPDLYTPDSAAFVDAARVMVDVNGYLAGTANQTVGYLVNGSSDDWMYGELGVFAFTPEIGGPDDGFWPDPSRLLPLAEQNVDMYRQAIRLAGPAATLGDVTVSAPGGFLDPGESGTLDVWIANAGFAPLPVAGATPASANPDVQLLGAPVTATTLAPGDRVLLASFPIQADADAPLGDVAGLSVTVSSPAGDETLAITGVRVGTPVALFESDAAALAGWTASGGWGVTTSVFVSPPGAFADSPSGEYPSDANAVLTLAQPLDLTGVAGASLEFSARWDIEASWDFLTVEASTNGTTWTPLAGRYTTSASGNGAQVPAGAPGYEGTQAAWVRESVSLSAYDGAPSLRLRFRLRADGFEERDGAYIDDIAVMRLTDGGTVSAPEGPSGLTTSLGPPSPNPTRAGVRLAVSIGRAGDVELAVLDVLGRRVRTLIAGDAPAGRTEVTWDGLDGAGAPVPAGVYVLRLATPDAVATSRVVVAR